MDRFKCHTCHGVDRLEGDNLWHGHVDLAQQLFEVFRVVMSEDVLRSAAVTDAHDHRGVVASVREDLATWV